MMNQNYYICLNIARQMSGLTRLTSFANVDVHKVWGIQMNISDIDLLKESDYSAEDICLYIDAMMEIHDENYNGDSEFEKYLNTTYDNVVTRTNEYLRNPELLLIDVVKNGR